MTSLILGIVDYRNPPADLSRIEMVAGQLGQGDPTAGFRDGPIALASSPAPRERGPFCLIDGYIDNADSLGRELGLSRSAAPELVVAAGYQRWDDGVLERLRGDFSLVIWDGLHRRGLVACDQFGTRSIFVSSSGSRLYFASDLHPLLELLPQRPSPDLAALLEYLSLKTFTQCRTMYEGISKVPPAHAIRLAEPGWRAFRYWAPRYQGVLDGSPDELAAEARRIMSAAVERRLASEGLTAITMSGGLDSTTVAALAVEKRPWGVRSYSTTLPDFPDEDESFWIERMRTFTGVPVTTFPTAPRGIVAAGLRNLLSRALPAMTTTDFVREPLMSAARRDGATILLGGDGGDEVFGVRDELIADEVRQGHLIRAIELGRRHPDAGGGTSVLRTLRAVLTFGYRSNRPHLFDDLDARFRGPAGYGPSWLRADSARVLLEARDRTTWKRAQGPRWWARLVDSVTRNHARVGLYDEVRRTANEHGLDPRHPLLDFELVEFALKLPPELSYDPDRNRPLLRRAMRGVLPEEVRLRPTKTNFVPVGMSALVREISVVHRILGPKEAEIYRYADPAGVQSFLDGTQTGGMLNQAWLDGVWRLFMAECWLQEQKDPGYAARLLETQTGGPPAASIGAFSPAQGSPPSLDGGTSGGPFLHLAPPVEQPYTAVQEVATQDGSVVHDDASSVDTDSPE